VVRWWALALWPVELSVGCRWRWSLPGCSQYSQREYRCEEALWASDHGDDFVEAYGGAIVVLGCDGHSAGVAVEDVGAAPPRVAREAWQPWIDLFAEQGFRWSQVLHIFPTLGRTPTATASRSTPMPSTRRSGASSPTPKSHRCGSG